MNDNNWGSVLAPIKQQAYFQGILDQVDQARKTHAVYPPNKDVFNAFRYTPYSTIKVVIIGQDPYHGPGQAHGLCFSVQPDVAIPPSLKNIYKELHTDLNISIPSHGDLSAWAKQGVLLLNSVLTVNQGQPQSHAQFGWQQFTTDIINLLNNYPNNLVFLLWGAHAARKCDNIDNRRHLILTAPHPSPLSAHRGFFGCQHFSKTNAWLTQQGDQAIDWQV